MSDVRYSEELLLWEYRLAVLDEIDIEGMVWEMTGKHLIKVGQQDFHALKHALRRIDELKSKGNYEQERERLRSLLGQESTSLEILDQDFAPLSNFFVGVDSADPAQQKRFRRMADAIGIWDMGLQEAWPILKCLEKGQKKKEGSPRKLPPWRDKARLLEGMRDDIARGLFKTVRASAIAAAEKSGPLHTVDNRAKVLARDYKNKMSLREQ